MLVVTGTTATSSVLMAYGPHDWSAAVVANPGVSYA